ncbi:UDP-N-acetylmuramoyl-tripeptide--D-alanyl-D-alanine ligase [Gracilibacillus marinus]|uniref:UDP-N-acetylmuramoyl-tripeptide--D-alanyl-D-alanine ligase n=1 Tax=Gracilibacillus marinus TaxID=630535 RepID=A0ABV8VZC8_9BACI
MITRTIAQVAEMANAQLSLPTNDSILVKGVTIDTRKIQGNELYVPLVGTNVDGHQFVRQAYEQGAAASFWKKDVPNPPADIPLLFVDDPLLAMQQLATAYRNQLDVQIIGITGSNGKTSTKDIVAQLLSAKYKVQKTLGNYNSQQGLPLMLLSIEEDTDIMVLEMGMSALGQISRLTQMAQPNVAILTNIGESHLEELGSRENIATAKFEITEGLSEHGLFVYDGDEPLLQAKLAEQTPSYKIKSFGMQKDADVYPISMNLVDNGTTFTCNLLEGAVHLPVLGLHQVKNTLAAITVATHLGVSEAEINQQLASLQLTGMRMETIDGIHDALIINDAYNASPTSMKAAIQLLDELDTYEKKIVFVADMLELGKDEVDFHKQIGAYIAQTSITHVFSYGNLAKHITDHIDSLQTNQVTQHVLEKDQVIDKLLQILDHNTVLLLKGSRGMKLEEVLPSLTK